MYAVLFILTILMLLAYIYAFANSEDPDETAPIGAVSSGSALFAIKNEFLCGGFPGGEHLTHHMSVSCLRYTGS